jgi:hypothetical protein
LQLLETNKEMFLFDLRTVGFWVSKDATKIEILNHREDKIHSPQNDRPRIPFGHWLHLQTWSGKLILEWMITKGSKQERQGPFLTLVIVALSGIIIADKYLSLLLKKGTALFSGIESLK